MPAVRSLALVPLLLAGACGFSPMGSGGEIGPDAGAAQDPADDPDDGAEDPDGDGEPLEPVYDAEILPLSEEVRAEMVGVSWHEGLGCPPLDDLALITLTHWGFDGEVHQGELVVAASAATAIAGAFGALFEAGFPIERIERVEAYGGSDDASMAANNTSAFNCRRVTGGFSLSQHSYGTAIDLNPVQNPYVNDDLVLPEEGEGYVERAPAQPGMALRPGAVDAFAAIGWEWGGDWDDPVDYQHFSANGL